jgi:anti-sigma-K factor RskA
MSSGEEAGEMTMTITERLAAADAETARVRASQAATVAMLDARDAETARLVSEQRARIAAMDAETRATAIRAAVRAAADERDGYPASWDYRAVLAGYGVDEYGRAVEGSVPEPR